VAKTHTPVFPQKARNINASFVTADGTNTKILVTGGIDDSIISVITITSSDSADKTIELLIGDGLADALIGFVGIPANTGSNGVLNPINGLSNSSILGKKIDESGNPYILLAAGSTLKARARTAVTAAATISVQLTVEDY
jgi:hypothetical protein